MIIRVVKRDSPYVQIDKTALEDPGLSFRAKGLHAYLMSRPDNWIPNPLQLATVSREGRDAVKAALRELQEAGYYERRREQKEDGTFCWVGNVYEVSKVHEPTDGNPGDGFPVTGKPVTGNPSTGESAVIKKEVIKKDKQERKNNSCATPPRDQKPKKPTVKRHIMAQMTEAYRKLRGVEPKPGEWTRIQREFKDMILDGNHQHDIIAVMEWAAGNRFDWSLHTVRKWLPDQRAGKLPDGSKKDKLRHQAARGRDPREYDKFMRGGGS